LKNASILLLVFFFYSCTSTTSTSTNSEEYVDIAAFFKSEIEQLTTQNVGVFKRTRMDTTTNTDSVDSPEWSKELYAFSDIHIKPSVWNTDYVLVNSEDDPNEVSNVFTTTNSRQKIKMFKLKMDDNGKIDRFYAEVVERGKLALTVTMLTYTKNVGYSVTIKRDTKIIGNESYQIVGQFYKNSKLK
jgi:hypothetical protein